MKTKDKKELHNKTIDELIKMLKDAQAGLTSLKLDLAQNKLKNTRSIFTIRREIAVIQTILREKELIKNG